MAESNKPPDIPKPREPQFEDQPVEEPPIEQPPDEPVAEDITVTEPPVPVPDVVGDEVVAGPDTSYEQTTGPEYPLGQPTAEAASELPQGQVEWDRPPSEGMSQGAPGDEDQMELLRKIESNTRDMLMLMRGILG